MTTHPALSGLDFLGYPWAMPAFAHPPSSRQFDLIAFDWDGTLFDSTASIVRSIQLAVVDVGGQAPSAQDASYVIGLGLMQALAHAAPDIDRSRYRELGQRYQYHYARHQNDISLFDGVRPLLAALKQRGHHLAVATGKSRQGLEEALALAQLQDVFDGARTADLTAGKPDPLMLHELMQEFDVPPQRVLMVGDTTHDLQMARNAGCACVAVSYGAHATEALAALQPRFVAHSVAELQTWLFDHG